jgi:hypothetical protein
MCAKPDAATSIVSLEFGLLFDASLVRTRPSVCRES